MSTEALITQFTIKHIAKSIADEIYDTQHIDINNIDSATETYLDDNAGEILDRLGLYDILSEYIQSYLIDNIKNTNAPDPNRGVPFRGK